MASIHILDPVVASRIAAGEVVERPASVLRELLDNAIDAGATKISVHIREGGIKSLTVSDNGCGMSEDDLVLACTKSATSKVLTLDVEARKQVLDDAQNVLLHRRDLALDLFDGRTGQAGGCYQFLTPQNQLIVFADIAVGIGVVETGVDRNRFV